MSIITAKKGWLFLTRLWHTIDDLEIRLKPNIGPKNRDYDIGPDLCCLAHKHFRNRWSHADCINNTEESLWKFGKRETERKKMRSWIYAILLVFNAMVLDISAKEQLSSKECENLGFTGLALCSDCNTFAEYVKDNGKSR